MYAKSANSYLSVVAVYFLGWWALLTYIVGAYFGVKVFFDSIKSDKNQMGE